MGNCLSAHKQYDGLSPQEKINWKFRAMVSSSIDNKFKLLEDPQYQGLLNFLNLIEDSIVVKFLERVNYAIFYHDPCCGFDKTKNFVNWGKTFETEYQQILYPSDEAGGTGRQVQVVQDFVKKGVKEGKRIRGAGIRHSWGKIFADPQQLLVSFYPYKVAKGTSRVLEDWAVRMTEAQHVLAYDGIEHLCEIRYLREIVDADKVKKHLVKVGAGVSNDQLRRWCIKNGYQYKSNVIMVEVNVCGGLGTCSHGAGIGTQTLADYVYEIEFIDYNGNRQIISKSKEPHLIKSAASALGLLGLVVFVTLELEDLDIVRALPRNSYKDFIIPWPKDYPREKIQARRKSKDWEAWNLISHKKKHEQNWQDNFKAFKKAVNQTYCEWFYFPIEQIHIFENVWNIFGKKTPQKLAEIVVDNKDGVFLDDYPPPAIKFFSEFTLFVGNELMNHELTQSSVNVLMRIPFAFFPHRNVYMNYPDAVHFQRGIQNSKVRDFEVEINIPSVNSEPDYDLIQRIWWTALEIVEENQGLVNVALEMRIFKGSEATLAPQIGFEYVCSIEILRTLTLNSSTDNAWKEVVMQVFNAWRSLKDSKGNTLLIRPHWGKEWDFYPQVKEHVFKDELFKQSVRKFLKDYEEIAKLKNFSHQKNLFTFSNQVYRELLNNAIEREEDKIK